MRLSRFSLTIFGVSAFGLIAIALFLTKARRDSGQRISPAMETEAKPEVITLLHTNPKQSEIEAVEEVPRSDIPTIAEEMAMLESEPDPEPEFFNYYHYTDLDLEELHGILQEKGLQWPVPDPEFQDDISTHNLRVRELQALRRIESDPAGAIKYFRTQIGMEEDKMITRAWMDEWRAEKERGGGNGKSVFAEMLPNLPDQHFQNVVIRDVMQTPQPQQLSDSILRESETRPKETRMKVYALLADRGHLPSQHRERVLRELLEFTGFEGNSETPWSMTVDMILDRNR